MKKLALLFLLITPFFCSSQKYLDEIALKSCECMAKIADTVKGEELQMQMGICMLNEAMPYAKQFKKDYDIDLKDDFIGSSKQLGAIIGVKLVQVCPDTFNEMVKRSNLLEKMKSMEEYGGEESTDEEVIEEEEELPSVIGEIVKVEKDFFVTFSVKDEQGTIKKYYWIWEVETDMDLESDYMTLTGKKVVLSYEEIEFFDPKIGEYRAIPVLVFMGASEE